MMNDLFLAKAVTKAANAPEGLRPNAKSKLRDQFHEVVGMHRSGSRFARLILSPVGKVRPDPFKP